MNTPILFAYTEILSSAKYFHSFDVQQHPNIFCIQNPFNVKETTFSKVAPEN